MLQPVKGIPLSVIIKAIADHKVIKFDIENPADAKLLKQLKKAIEICAAEIKQKPIRRARPNEVGNDVEEYVMSALRQVGLRPERQTPANGQGKATGYPDIVFWDTMDRPTYLECKIFAEGGRPNTMRSFYLSPSDSFKVSLDARHLLLAYGMEKEATEAGSGDSFYRPRSYKLVDLYDLLCDIKHEFNSDNQRLYAKDLIRLQGEV
jgi:hypothetical protein